MFLREEILLFIQPRIRIPKLYGKQGVKGSAPLQTATEPKNRVHNNTFKIEL
jgi:hypothetical protein